MRETFRRITLASQGLTQTAPFGSGRAAVLAAVQHLGYIQIDTLAVIERAHHHTLWTRIPDYQPEMLDALLAERQLFEYWFHAAAYLPMRDFRYALPQMNAVKHDDAHVYRADPQVMRAVMDTIRAEGPKKPAILTARPAKPAAGGTGNRPSWRWSGCLCRAI